jgi:hypothetical protein
LRRKAIAERGFIVIKYRLKCAQAHEFEGWFPSSTSYDAQVGGRQICCPDCGSRDVVKAIMAPNLAARARAPESGCPVQTSKPGLVEFLREIRRSLLSASENVGSDFAEEARKIHYGEAEARGIWGRRPARKRANCWTRESRSWRFPLCPRMPTSSG